MTNTTTRQANHLAITDSGTVHYAADSNHRPYHILACNGRAIDAAGVGLSQSTVSCRSCLAGERTGRIEVRRPFRGTLTTFRSSEHRGQSYTGLVTATPTAWLISTDSFDMSGHPMAPVSVKAADVACISREEA